MAKKSAHLLDTRFDRTVYVFNYFLLFLFLVIIAYPLIFVVSASFSSPSAVIGGRVHLLPVEPTLEGYEAVFKHRLIQSGFVNSIIYTVTGTVLNVVLTILAAYPLSRHDFRGRNLFMFMITFTMLFSGGMIPDYLLVRDLGLRDTIWAIILPGAISAYNVIITRTFFKSTIPRELLEAAQIDRCDDYQFVWRIVLPLSTPIIGVIALFYAVGHWNSYFQAMIYLNTPSKFPLQIVLREVLILNNMDTQMLGSDLQEMLRKQNLKELLKYSLIVVSSLPMMIIYPFVQRYFVQGVMIGSIKG